MSPDQPPVNVNVNQQPPGVFVSLKDILDVATATRTEVAGLRSDVARVLSTDADHESRIRVVEAAQAKAQADAQANYVTKSQARWALGTLIGVVVAVTAVLGLILR